MARLRHYRAIFTPFSLALGAMLNKVKYELAPSTDWLDFDKNEQVTKLLFDSLMPSVKKGLLSYLNFTSETGMFEEDSGNSLCVTFVVSKKVEKIQSIDICLNTEGIISQTAHELESTFGLFRK